MLYAVLEILMFYTVWKVSVFGVFLVCTQPECGKIRTRKTPNTDTFHAVLLTYFSLDVFSFEDIS